MQFFSRTSFSRSLGVLLVLVGMTFAGLSHGIAQTDTDKELQKGDPDQTIRGWEAELNQIESAVGRDGVSDDELIMFRDRLAVIHKEAQAFAEAISPQIDSLSDQLSKLTSASGETKEKAVDGEAATQKTQASPPDLPKEVPPQAVEASPSVNKATVRAKVAAEQVLNDQKVALETDLALARARFGRAQVVVLRSEEFSEKVTQLRRDKFTSRLFNYSKPVLDPTLWLAGVKELPWMVRGFINVIEGGIHRVLTDAPLAFWASLVLSALMLALVLRRWSFLKITEQKREEEIGPTQSTHKERNAIKRVIRFVLLLTFVPGVVLFTLEQVAVLSPRLSEFFWSILDSVFYFAIAVGLARAIFSSKKPGLRLVDMPDDDALIYERMVLVCTTIALIGRFALHFSQIMVASLDVTVLIYGSTAMVFTIVGFLTWRRGDGDHGSTGFFVPQILVLRIIGGFVLVAFLTAFLAPLAGYAFLGAFAVNQVILAGIIAGVLYLMFRLMDGFVGFEAEHGVGNVPVIRASDAHVRRKAQVLLLVNGITKIVLIFFGLIVFAASWGLDTIGFWGDFAGILSGFKVGKLTISPATLLTAIVLLVLGVLLTRALKRWFANRLLPTTDLDIGLRNSITTAIGYVGYLGAAMIAFSQAGLDLSNLAIVAGALSVGIGFGLQSIVSNFVSGIILLAERPIKAGDWIEVGGEEGTVKKISVRSTEIETFDRATVIVPNADFISGSVKNMMYGNTIGRFIITIGVGYDSDPDQVKEILLACAKEHPLVLSYPESYVLLSEFGASSLDFELRGYIADCGTGLGVRSDLRFAILRQFRAAGIEIPFPQRDLNVKTVEAVFPSAVAEDKPIQKSTVPPSEPFRTTRKTGDDAKSDNEDD